MDAPEIRLSPDGRDVAIRNLSQFGKHPVLRWRTTNGLWLTDKEVTDWNPLVPASNKDGAVNEAQPVTLRPRREPVRYNQLWSMRSRATGAERFLRITKVGQSRAEGYTWRASENGGRVTRILKQTITSKWRLVEDSSDGAA